MNKNAISQAPDAKQEEEDKIINIKLFSSLGEEVFFKVKYTTKLSKLLGAYANKVGKDVNSIRFLYDGKRFNDDNTPASLEMEDDAVIEVMVEQLGG
ncbi:ubiquitin-like protein SMT3 [Russula decolorans]